MHKNANITIDGPRLNEDIAFTSRFGATPRGGIRRLALSAEDRLVRDWLATHGEALGCSITMDTMGSQFLRLEGSDPTLPPLMMGSHLDTQPTGGRYDGIYGVLGGWRYCVPSGRRDMCLAIQLNWPTGPMRKGHVLPRP